MSRGNPGIDLAEILRRRIWYFNVRKKSGKTNYYLSKVLDLNKDFRSNRQSGKVRRRIFERLEKFDEMPFRGKREQFVNLVESHAGLAGTANFYLSVFWELVSKKPMSRERLRVFILACARQTDLLKVVGNYDDQQDLTTSAANMSPSEGFMFMRSSVEHYREALELALSDRPASLDLLALVGGLYREAYFSGNLRLALMLEGVFGNLLQEITEAEWMPESISGQMFGLTAERVLTVAMPGWGHKLTRYVDLLSQDENIGSPMAMLLSRHDRLIGMDDI